MRLAFIDLETTGSKASRDRIIEIAIKVVEDDEVLESWSSLLQPDCLVPEFIQQFTGIHQAMLANAPRFEDLAEQVDNLTQGCLFVAHNARFDYSFIKAEFKRLQRPYKRPTLCTVKLAKALYPEFKAHGLDALIQRHQLHCEHRHRAMGDVDVTLAFFLLAKQEKGTQVFEAAIAKQVSRPSLPAALSDSDMQAVPEAPGVYYFYGENDVLLYVGKSVNLYQRVMSHFSSDHSSEKEMRLAQSIRRLDWECTAGDLGAQLLELERVRDLQPVHNRRLRASANQFALVLRENTEGYLQVQVLEAPVVSDLKGAGEAPQNGLFGLFRTQKAALRQAKKLTEENQLCKKLCGLESGGGACFGHSTGQCGGACVGAESLERYNLRVLIGMHAIKLKVWPYAGPVWVREHTADALCTQWHLLSDWQHIASCYSEDDVRDYVFVNEQGRMLDADTYRILARFFKSHSASDYLIVDANRFDTLA